MRPGNVSTFFLLLILIVAVSYCGKRSKSEVKVPIAKKVTPVLKQIPEDSVSNSTTSLKKQSLTREESDFILKANDARMMGILEGKAALKKGSTKQIRDYGALMVADQTKMLASLTDLSKSLSIKLPDSISKDKQDALRDLVKRDSKKFDKKFVRMVKIDHRRDVKLFTKAKDYHNLKVTEYATRYLPLIESHLEKSKNLRKKEPRIVKERIEKVKAD